MKPGTSQVGAERGRVVRFLASGAANTAITYLLYLIALAFLSPVVAYSLVYAIGIVLAYVLNRAFVFRSHSGWKSALATPLIYLLQYGISVVVINLWVGMGWRSELAPLPAIVLSLPVTYLLSRLTFLLR
jgi:putative flippase GtrA